MKANESVDCDHCGQLIIDKPIEGRSFSVCPDCFRFLRSQIETKATRFAVQHFKFTKDISAAAEWIVMDQVTLHERCRDELTNYRELLESLSFGDGVKAIYRRVISEVAENLVRQQLSCSYTGDCRLLKLNPLETENSRVD